MISSSEGDKRGIATPTDGQRRKERVALLSVLSNSTLVIIKLIVGLVIGSVSVSRRRSTPASTCLPPSSPCMPSTPPVSPPTRTTRSATAKWKT